MSEMQVISADSHIQEPPELFSEWLDTKYRDRTPRRETRGGKTYVIVDGKKPRRVDLADERATEDDQNREFRSDPTGGRDVIRRLSDMARDGVVGEVIYPNSSLSLYLSPDPGYQYAVARAYNDWLIQKFRLPSRSFRAGWDRSGYRHSDGCGGSCAGGEAGLSRYQGAAHCRKAPLQFAGLRAALVSH